MLSPIRPPPPPRQAFCQCCGELGAHGSVDECLVALTRACDALRPGRPPRQAPAPSLPTAAPRIPWKFRAERLPPVPHIRPPISGVSFRDRVSRPDGYPKGWTGRRRYLDEDTEPQ